MNFRKPQLPRETATIDERTDKKANPIRFSTDNNGLKYESTVPDNVYLTIFTELNPIQPTNEEKHEIYIGLNCSNDFLEKNRKD